MVNMIEPWAFVTVLIFSFSLFLLITGAFTAYFGSGKSRKIGAGLLLGGILIGVIWAVLRYLGVLGPAAPTSGWMVDVVVQTIVTVLAVVIGAGVAIGLFLLAIMKS